MKIKPDQSICRFGASVMSRYLTALRQEMAGVRQGVDIEAIHRMRVASRRMRSALPLFETCYANKYQVLWRTEIRQVTRALGQARDTDVQIDALKRFLASLQEKRCRPGINRLLLRLHQKRAGLQVKVNQALEELQKSQALESLEEKTNLQIVERTPGEPVTYALYNLAQRAIYDNLTVFLGYEKYISNPDAVAELHAMRIAAKQLRYTLEIFSPLYADELKSYIQSVKTAQEMLGEIHDCDVWSVLVPQFLEKEHQRIVKFYGHAGFYHMLLPGIEGFQENRRAYRNETYLKYLEEWKKWKIDGIWDRLDGTIEQPTQLSPEQEFYPSAAAALPVDTNDD
jgi:CHAD domain-containing protein